MFRAGILVLAAAVLAPVASIARQPEVRYRLTYVPTPAPGTWDIEVTVSGLGDQDAGVYLHLPTAGARRRLADSDAADLRGTPPLVEGAGRSGKIEFTRVDEWDGRLHVSYRIALVPHGSEQRDKYGVLPWRLQRVARGFAHDVLPSVRRANGWLLDAKRTVEITAPAGMSIVTGWKGLSKGKQTVELDGDVDQCLIVFDPAPRVSRRSQRGQVCEVYQFGEGVTDITRPVLDATHALLVAIARTTGRPLGRVERVFITGVDPSGGGGIRTDHGIELTYSKHVCSPAYLQTLSHELFHEWLPGVLRADGAQLVWFFEGFTDYLALWHAVRAGVISPESGAVFIHQHDRSARSNPVYGKLAFSDVSVRWRDGQGPIEMFAYRGGASLAFHLDVELRTRNKGSTVGMLADLLAASPPRYSLLIIRRWLRQRGLESFYDRHIAGTGPLPDSRSALRMAGLAVFEDGTRGRILDEMRVREFFDVTRNGR